MQNANSLTLEQVQSWLTPRAHDANKGSFGRVCVVGSDYGMPGAVRIVAEGALRIGAGLVSVITHPEHVPTTVCGRPELLCYATHPNFEGFDHVLSNASIIVVGPGLGQSLWSNTLLDKVLLSSAPLVIDADALNLLSHVAHEKITRSNWILTPHPGEAARLLGVSINDIQDNRMAAIDALQKKYNGVVVLKGAGSLVATDHQPIQLCSAGNPGMASAGMGDLLSGIIAGLVAQGLSLWQAAQAGVVLHACAGDRVAAKQGQRGLLASDLLKELPYLIN